MLSIILTLTIVIPLVSFDSALAVAHPVISKCIYLEPIPEENQITPEDKEEIDNEIDNETANDNFCISVGHYLSRIHYLYFGRKSLDFCKNL